MDFWNNASTASAGMYWQPVRRPDQIECRVRMLVDPMLCRSGHAIDHAASIDLCALGLWITGTRVHVTAGLVGSLAGVDVAWCSALLGNSAAVLGNLRVQVAKVFLGAVAELIAERERMGKSVADAWPIIGLAAPAPEDGARSAYRAAAKDAHPDTGGSDERMKSVNAAWDPIVKAMGWRP